LLATLRQYSFDARPVWGEVTLPLAKGLLAHARGDWQQSLAQLTIALPRLNEIGGSHAQRDLFALVELDARVKAGDWLGAQQTLELRRRYDGGDVPTNRSLVRVYEALKLPELAAKAQTRLSPFT